jgi:hypothetical protein
VRRLRLTVAALAALLAAAAPAGAAVPFHELGVAAGPLSHVAAGADLSCQASHTGDAAFDFAPQTVAPGDCGTLVAVDGRLFAPDFAAHDATGSAALGAYTSYDRRGQVADGANAVTTTVGVGATGLEIVQRDVYLPGQDAWRTDVTVRNAGAATKSIVLYRAGDCHLQGTGTGYGFSGSPDGSVGCSAQPGNAPLDRVIQWVPITGAGGWMQGRASDVWSRIAARTPFSDECLACTGETDAAAGLSWALDVAPGAAETRSHWTVLSPTGRTGPPLPVAAPPVPPVATDVGAGTTITFTGPARCITPPQRYRLRVTSMRKRKLSRDRFGYIRRVRVLQVEFRVDGKRRLTDRRAAFKALMTSAGSAPGEHALEARVLLQPLRERGRQRLVGKKFRRTLESTVNVCSS